VKPADPSPVSLVIGAASLELRRALGPSAWLVFDTSASYSGSAETDIIYQHGTGVPAGLSGIAWCDDAISAIRCDQHYIRFTSANPGTALSAHETGHAVGLAHPNNADPPQAPNDALFQTMVTPVFTSNLGAHNIQQINSIY
jgi:hypothetical protein